MDLVLHPVEVRVLGALLEKEITTPEYYPLSLNALVNACNQKSNRDPAVNYDEDLVEQALRSLREKNLLLTITGAGSRVQKYGHRISERLNLGRPDLAVLCELMLRGPQTVGELRTHAARMHPFDDLEQVQNVLDRSPELFTRLERRPGEKESRYAQLLSEVPAATAEPAAAYAASSAPPRQDRIAALESEVAQLRSDVNELREQLAGFKKQFE